MARPARIEFEGAFYHVTNRGNRKERLFVDDSDRYKFYEILSNIEARYSVSIYAFVLMTSHYHLLLETEKPNLSRAIQRLNGDYALYFNRRHKMPGHLFQGRFKAMLVEKERYLLELIRYIHLNPVRAGMVKTANKYKWSSLPVYLAGTSDLPFTLQWEWILSMFGKQKKLASKRYLDFIREGTGQEFNPVKEAVGGWLLGGEKWVKKVLKKEGNFKSGELTGIKQLKPKVPVTKFEELVCGEFEVTKAHLRKDCYNNFARQAILYLSVDYSGLTLKDAGQKYGIDNYLTVGKVLSRFRKRLAGDHILNNKIRRIVSTVKM